MEHSKNNRAMYANEIKGYLLKYIKKTEKDYVAKDEVPINNSNSIVDILVINGSIHAYEIKSAYDKVDRLPSQLLSYSSFSNKVSLVLSDVFYEKNEEYIKKVREVYKNIEILSFKEKSKKIEKILDSNSHNELSKNAYASYWTSRELSVFLSGYTKGLSRQLREYFLALPCEVIKNATLTMLKERYSNKDINETSYSYSKALPKLKEVKNIKVENSMSRYVPFIPMSATAKELLGIIENSSVIPYLGIRKFGNSPKSEEIFEKEKTNYLSDNIKQIINQKKHFVDYHNNIVYPNTAIKVFNATKTVDKSIIGNIFMEKGDEIAIKINPKNYKILDIKSLILDYLKSINKTCWIILNYSEIENYDIDNVMSIYEDILNLGLNAKLILLGSNVSEQYAGIYDIDKQIEIPNNFLMFFEEVSNSIDNEVYYGDYLGYEQNTSVVAGFSPMTYPRIVLLDKENPYRIYYVRLSVTAKTEKRDFAKLKPYIETICEDAHCLGCKSLLEKDLWTNTVKRYCFLHNIKVMVDYFNNNNNIQVIVYED